MSIKPNDNTKMLLAGVPEEVHRALKIHAEEEGQSVTVIVEGLIRQYLAKMDLLERRKNWRLDAQKSALRL